MDFSLLSAQQALTAVKSAREGLTREEAAARGTGRNVLQEGKKKTWLRRVLSQFANPMVLVLVGASVLSGAFGEWVDTLIIAVVVVLNAVLGVTQEGKAERAIARLKGMSTPLAQVRRSGVAVKVPSPDLVVGDVVELTAGDVVPADLRLLEVAGLTCEEAALTGESMPAEKISGALGAQKPLGDRRNMAFSAAKVTAGRGVGVAVAVGQDTEVGRVAALLKDTDEGKTPLQARLGEVSRVLSVVVLCVCALIFGVGLIWGKEEPVALFVKAVGIAVAAIPEGLAAVVTLVLAMGVQRMSKRGALIRKMNACETLGCVGVICSDKTGTLTQNKMTVTDVWLAPDAPQGSAFFEALALCNNTTADNGSPTEVAILRYAARYGAAVPPARRLTEVPFSSERKRMSVAVRIAGREVCYCKGAAECVLAVCAMTATARAAAAAAATAMSARGLRVLAAAYKPAAGVALTEAGIEKDLRLLGLVGIEDPPREGVGEAVATCARAGIRTVMITGDHPETAAALAKKVGISTKGGTVTGSDLDAMTDKELQKCVKTACIFARVSPQHKIAIVQALKREGHIVAMTGDGVNDAPALKGADVGVGMGLSGTDVAKDVSDIVLSDDNFTTIVAAVEEGRKIYGNIRKTIGFLLSCNMSEIIVLFLTALLGMRFLSTVQILFVNLITDTFPAVALGLEDTEGDVMRRPPRRADEGFFAGGMLWRILFQGLCMSAITYGAFAAGLLYGADTAATMAFVALSVTQLFHCLNLRSETRSVFARTKPNLFLFLSNAVLLAFTVVIVNVPAISALLHCVPLTAVQWLVVLGIAALIIPVCELEKALSRRARRRCCG
ncbi:MAG: cation-transporting P-type ATPase [Clostridiales bacterium]|jgi:Ca2+-transporting ATPase|nr:cation-transporting P-type ATPase [Clostridiales bacterium]